MTAKLNLNALTTPEQITKAIALVHRRADTLQLDIHKILVAIGQQWAKTGDIRPAVVHVNTLLDGMPGGVRSNALRKWVEVFFGFILPTEGDNKGKFIAGPLKAGDLLLDKLTNTRWWEFTPEAPYKPLDFAAELGKLVKKATERADKTTTGDYIPADLLAGVKALMTSTQGASAH